MNKSMIMMVLLLLVSSLSRFRLDMLEVNEKLNKFYKEISQSGISYIIKDNVYVIYDFEYINEISSEFFNDYRVYLVKYTDTFFGISIEIERGFLKRTITEEYEIKKGDKYEKFN